MSEQPTPARTPAQGPPTGGYRFFPDHVLTEVNIGLAILFLCSVLAIVLPAEMSEKANPLVTPAHIKPEWYFFPMYKWIKMTPEMVGILVPLLVVLIFVFWPFVDRVLVKLTGSKIVPLVVGLAGMVFVTLLMVLEAFA
ncbi:MAG: cytochrome b subunit of the bc complex [Deferrisomatales bacterium]